MPSPIGHALAGAAVVWGADAVDRRQSTPTLVATAAILAAAPDFDLLLSRFHRTATHSLLAVLLVFMIAAAVTGRVTRWRTAWICAAAYASHLLLDWLGVDQFMPSGIQLLWPFGQRFFISGWDIFGPTERRDLFLKATMDQNLRTVAREVLILAPIAAASWLIRVKALSRFPSKVARGHHAAK
jgi:inner membrane protein